MSKTLPYRIETKRLILRQYELSDAGALKKTIDESLEHLRPWMPWAQHEPQTIEEKVERIKHFHEKSNDKEFILAIFDKTGTHMLGSTGLQNRRAENAREIGYWIHADHIHKGYATEAVSALTKIGFDTQAIDYMEIRPARENVSSQAIPKKLGYILQPDTDLEGHLVFTMQRDYYESSPIGETEMKMFDREGNEIEL